MLTETRLERTATFLVSLNRGSIPPQVLQDFLAALSCDSAVRPVLSGRAAPGVTRGPKPTSGWPSPSFPFYRRNVPLHEAPRAGGSRCDADPAQLRVWRSDAQRGFP